MNECLKCNKQTKNQKFCSKSCSAKFNNKIRFISDESKLKTSLSMKKHFQENPMSDELKKNISIRQIGKKRKKTSELTKQKISLSLKKNKENIQGEYCKLYKNTCKVCKRIKIGILDKKLYCDDCKKHHSNLRTRFQFQFNVYEYPNLFDLDLLKEKGWYSPKGKSGKWNPDGLSRDHRVSISESIKNNYDPYYINHPLNCELMLHRKNSSKRDKSSLSYSDLKKMVDEYDRN